MDGAIRNKWPPQRATLPRVTVTDGIVLLVRGVLFTKSALATKRHSKRQDGTISAPRSEQMSLAAPRRRAQHATGDVC